MAGSCMEQACRGLAGQETRLFQQDRAHGIGTLETNAHHVCTLLSIFILRPEMKSEEVPAPAPQ